MRMSHKKPREKRTSRKPAPQKALLFAARVSHGFGHEMAAAGTEHCERRLCGGTYRTFVRIKFHTGGGIWNAPLRGLVRTLRITPYRRWRRLSLCDNSYSPALTYSASFLCLVRFHSRFSLQMQAQRKTMKRNALWETRKRRLFEKKPPLDSRKNFPSPIAGKLGA